MSHFFRLSFVSALTLLSLWTTNAGAEDCCEREMSMPPLIGPGSLSDGDLRMMQASAMSGFFSGTYSQYGRPEDQYDCPLELYMKVHPDTDTGQEIRDGLRYRLKQSGLTDDTINDVLQTVASTDYYLQCNIEELPMSETECTYVFDASLIDSHHGNAVVAGPVDVSWKQNQGDVTPGYWILNDDATKQNLLQELVNRLMPFDDKIYDYERKPVSCVIEPEKEEVEGGETITIDITNIRDHEERIPKPWQRIVVEVTAGKIKNANCCNKHPYYIFQVSDSPESNTGTVEIEYEAPETCDFDTETIKVYNSCNQRGELCNALWEDLLAEKEIKIEDRQPSACEIRPGKTGTLAPGEKIAVRLTDFVERYGGDLRPEEKILVKVDDGLVLNGQAHGVYRIFTIGDGTVRMDYQAPDWCGIKKDTLTVYSVCENKETGVIGPGQQIAEKKFNIHEVICDLTVVISGRQEETIHTHQEGSLSNGDYHSTAIDSVDRSEAIVQVALKRNDTSVDEEVGTMTHTYTITQSRLQSFLYSQNYRKTDTDFDSSEGCTRVTEIVQHSVNLPARLEAGDDMSVTFDLATGVAKWISIPSLAVMSEIRQTIIEETSGCGSESSFNDELTFQNLPFVVGPVTVVSDEEMTALMQPQMSEIEQIASEMQGLSEQIQSMDYAALEKFADDFEKRYDTDKLARDMTDKLINPDLRVAGGDSKSNFEGGGRTSDTEAIEHGTKTTIKEFKWSISINN